MAATYTYCSRIKVYESLHNFIVVLNSSSINRRKLKQIQKKDRREEKVK